MCERWRRVELVVPEMSRRDLTLDWVETVRGDVPADEEPVYDAPPDGEPAGPARGYPPRVVPPLRGRVSVGGPFADPVTPEFVAANAELSAFVRTESAHHEYHVVYMSVSFAARPATPRLVAARVELTLSSTVRTPEPVALSMSPRHFSDSTQVQRVLKLGPQLSLLEVEAGLGEVSRTTTREDREYFLQALNPMRSDPVWEFRRTKAMDHVGAYDQVMVVRTARGAATSVSGVVSASTKGNVWRWYEQDLPEPLRLASVF